MIQLIVLFVQAKSADDLLDSRSITSQVSSTTGSQLTLSTVSLYRLLVKILIHLQMGVSDTCYLSSRLKEVNTQCLSCVSTNK